jgi:carbon storage regulator
VAGVEHGEKEFIMLVLTRRPGESIVLPGVDVTITILRVHGDKAALGITAPRFVEVYRDEIWRRIQNEQANLITTRPVLVSDNPVSQAAGSRLEALRSREDDDTCALESEA